MRRAETPHLLFGKYDTLRYSALMTTARGPFFLDTVPRILAAEAAHGAPRHQTGQANYDFLQPKPPDTANNHLFISFLVRTIPSD